MDRIDHAKGYDALGAYLIKLAVMRMGDVLIMRLFDFAAGERSQGENTVKQFHIGFFFQRTKESIEGRSAVRGTVDFD